MKKSSVLIFLVFFIPLLKGGNQDIASFTMVWETIRDKHWNLEATGVDWQKIHDIYKPKVVESSNRMQTRTLINQMLGELGQSHFKILERGTHDELNELRNQFPLGNDEPGFQVALIEERIFVVAIDAESDAFRQGLGIGTEILKVRNVAAGELAKKIRQAFNEDPHAPMYISRTLNELMSGYTGRKLDLGVRIAHKEKQVSVALQSPKGRTMQLLNLPGVHYSYESKILDNNIGYITFNLFTMEARRTFEQDIMGKLKHTDGLILDLRGNPGGLGLVSVGMANRLVTEKGKRLGQMTNSGGTMNFAIFPQKPGYHKPLAILLDEGSASTSEILAAGLQDLKRAELFGTRSAGAALPSLIIDLPNGDRFQYAIADYVSFAGRNLEGVGVLPDHETPHTLKSMKENVDATMQAASLWIGNQTTKKGASNENL